jgi:stage III sporulation protein AG
VLLLLSTYFSSLDNDSALPNIQPIEAPLWIIDETPSFSQHSSIASELEEILSLVAGAGQVRVMLTTSNNREVVFAQDTSQNMSLTQENDGEGGIRNVETTSASLTYVMMRQNDGSEAPLLLKEAAPTIQGVVIVAEGAGEPAVTASLTRAAATVLGIAPHQVQVLQMSQ